MVDKGAKEDKEEEALPNMFLCVYFVGFVFRIFLVFHVCLVLLTLLLFAWVC